MAKASCHEPCLPAFGCGRQKPERGGWLPAPRPHPSPASTARSMGKGWFLPGGARPRRTRPQVRLRRCPAAAGASSGGSCPAGLLVPGSRGLAAALPAPGGTSSRRGAAVPRAPASSGMGAEAGGQGVGAVVALGALPSESPTAEVGAAEPWVSPLGDTPVRRGLENP